MVIRVGFRSADPHSPNSPLALPLSRGYSATITQIFRDSQMEIQTNSKPLASTESGQYSLQKIAYSHDAMIDFIMVNPRATQIEIAAHFGYTKQWVSKLFCSDAFQARLAERRQDLIDPTIIATVDEKLKTLANQSLDVLITKMETSNNFDQALKTAELATKALGYGAKQVGSNNVQNNFVVALPEKSASTEDWLKTQGRGEVVDAEMKELPEAVK